MNLSHLTHNWRVAIGWGMVVAIAMSHHLSFADNFTGGDAEFVKRAEAIRSELAVTWLGHELPDWTVPCDIVWEDHNGYSRSFIDYNTIGPIKPIRIRAYGPRQTVIGDCLRHEVMHGIWFTVFGRDTIPWINEGTAVCVESRVRRKKVRRVFLSRLRNDEIPALHHLLRRTRQSTSSDLVFSVHSHSFVEWLVTIGTKSDLLELQRMRLRGDEWTVAFERVYGFASLQDVQDEWLAWVTK